MPPALINDRFIRACRRQPVDRTPVWFMRQAGRYMAEYQAIRKNHSILEVCKTPELAAEVTLQPIERFPLDAAIIFADILLPLEPMGLNLSFVEDKGPVIANPVRCQEDVARLKVVDGDAFRFSHEAMTLTLEQLAGRVPLIGFAGGPFTLQFSLLHYHQTVHVFPIETMACSVREVCERRHELSSGANSRGGTSHSIV